MAGVGSGMVALGQSLAMFLVYEALMGWGLKAGVGIQETMILDQDPLANRLARAERGQPLVVSVLFPWRFEYVDYFGAITSIPRKNTQICTLDFG